MNAALAHSELNFNFRLFAKTRSASAAWGFDRLRLFNPKWHTKIQIRRPDGTVLATQDFSSVQGFEHDFSFDLSENVANDEYSVYVAGVPAGAAFNQAYAYPTGYSATTGKNAELTYWDFREVNVIFSGTSGRIRFENNPITNIDGALLLEAGEVNFANCSLGAETLADMLIGLDNSGITGGTFNYTGNLAAPAERALAAYNNLKDTKAWGLTGAIPAVAAGTPVTGLIADYTFNELSGALIDSVNAHNGTLYGTFNARDGEKYVFGGYNPYIDLGDNDDFSFTDVGGDMPFTIRMKVSFQNFTNGFIFNKRGASGSVLNEYSCGIYNGVLIFGLIDQNNGGASISRQILTSNLTLNTVYHIVFSYDGSGTVAGIVFKIDKSEINVTSNDSVNYVGVSNLTAPLEIGRMWNLYADISLYDFRIHKGYQWTNAEIDSDYNAIMI